MKVAIVAAIGVCLAMILLTTKSAKAPVEQAAAPVKTAAAAPETVPMTDAQLAGAAISLGTAGPADIATVSTMTGVIRFNADKTAHVVPRLPGVVEAVHADLGQRVKKGDVLVVIASAALAEHRSALLTAQARLRLATTTFEREKKLWLDRISAEQDYLQARQAMQEAQIEAGNARQKLAAFGVAAGATRSGGTLNTYQLRAPFDGVIVEKHVATGESIKEDTNIFTISDLSTVWADIDVPANALETVRVGAKATLRAASFTTEAHGTITYIGDLLGEQTRSAKARVVLTNPQAMWRPGLFVSIDVAGGATRAPLAIAADAIHTVEDKPTAFVRVKDGFEVRHLGLGKSDGKVTEVLAGLKAGERYAAANSFVVKAELGKSGAEHAD